MSAAGLRALHVPGRPLVLPNVWDVASARIVAEAGFPAVATSSGAVAQALGYADHEQAPAAEMFAAAARIVRAVAVPVTVDAEAGYGLPPAELAARLAEIGAAGCNIEDTDHVTGSLRDAESQAERLTALREAATDQLVINARVDCFLGASDEPGALPEALKRAKRYIQAGADCVYPIMLRSTELIRTFVRELDPAAVNVLGAFGDTAVEPLAELGVARISFGLSVFRSHQSWLRDQLAAFAGKPERIHSGPTGLV